MKPTERICCIYHRGMRRRQSLCLGQDDLLSRCPSALTDPQWCCKFCQQIVVLCSLCIPGMFPHYDKDIGSANESTAELLCLGAVLSMVLVIHEGHLLIFVSISCATQTHYLCKILLHSTFKNDSDTFNDLLLGCQIE